MLNGNKLVIILPLLLMGFIFYGGYHYLNQSAAITNEQLFQVIDMDANISKFNETVEVHGTWNWEEMPIEGLIGKDYIGVSLIDGDSGNQLDNLNVKQSQLFLKHGEKVIFQAEGLIVENGLIFAFPNEIIEHESYGNKGEFIVTFMLEEEITVKASIVLLHTWEEHEGLILTDARMVNPEFTGDVQVAFWTTEWTILE